MTDDSRQRIISRRVLTPKGGDEGGGGGEEPGAGTVRKDFRVLAFWVGSVVTDANGQASVDVTLPESLTTYRIMAVAADKAVALRLGRQRDPRQQAADAEAGVPALPGAGRQGVVRRGRHQPAEDEGHGDRHDPEPRSGDARGRPARRSRRAALAAGGAAEVRFDAVAQGDRQGAHPDDGAAGRRDRRVRGRDPGRGAGVAGDRGGLRRHDRRGAREASTLPAGVVAGFGGLSLELASTALVGLGEGARYLVEYPYGCAEQRSSRALALLLAADLGDAFALPGHRRRRTRSTISQAQITQLEQFQCRGGGFAYWPGECRSVSPYLTSYVLHVFQVARARSKYKVNAEVHGARLHLPREASWPSRTPENESWIPAYTAWQAFAVKVLAEGGRNAGLAHHAALRLPRSHAGVRPRLSRRRDGGQGRERAAPRRAAAAHEERRCCPRAAAPTSRS